MRTEMISAAMTLGASLTRELLSDGDWKPDAREILLLELQNRSGSVRHGDLQAILEYWQISNLVGLFYTQRPQETGRDTFQRTVFEDTLDLRNRINVVANDVPDAELIRLAFSLSLRAVFGGEV